MQRLTGSRQWADHLPQTHACTREWVRAQTQQRPREPRSRGSPCRGSPTTACSRKTSNDGPQVRP